MTTEAKRSYEDICKELEQLRDSSRRQSAQVVAGRAVTDRAYELIGDLVAGKPATAAALRLQAALFNHRSKLSQL